MIPPLLVLFSWPIVALVLFKKYRAPVAILATMIGGYLLLPTRTSLDLPLLPALNKSTIPVLSVFAVAFLLKVAPNPPQGARRILTHSPLANILLLALLISPFATVFTNLDTLRYGPTVIQAMRPYDAFSNTLTSIMILLPFILGYRFLGAPREITTILYALMIGALAYSVLALYEIRMSPQLNRMVYGFFPHNWLQHMRGGGFRPLVFLEHGLRLSLFFVMALLAALICMKTSTGTSRKRLLWASAYLFVVLVLSKSLGALLTGLALAPVVYFCSIRTQLMAAAALAAVVMTYPMLRGAGLVPTQAILSQIESFSPERAHSLGQRIHHEENLLVKAEKRPLFGWSGAYGRNRVYNERGRDISVTDGYWAIIIGAGGWVRYIATFGLLGTPIILLAWRSRKVAVGPETAGLSMVMAANLFDLLPNSGVTPITWLLSGAIWARLAYVHVDSDDKEAAAPPDPRAIRYARARKSHVQPNYGRAHAGGNMAVDRKRDTRAPSGQRPDRHAETEFQRPYAPRNQPNPRKT